MFRTLSRTGGMALVIIAFLPIGSLAADDSLARKLFNSQGCKACHTLEGDGGKDDGSFEEMRERLSRAEVRLQLVNPAGTHGKGSIHDFSHLSDTEIEALVSFIQPAP